MKAPSSMDSNNRPPAVMSAKPAEGEEDEIFSHEYEFERIENDSISAATCCGVGVKSLLQSKAIKIPAGILTNVSIDGGING